MLSVIVPVYNTSKYLPHCIMSLVNQTYKDLEIVLVDDGSTDISGKLCDDYPVKYQNIRVIHKKNGGLISAWTEGTKYCNGDYVGYVDSDDWVAPDFFELLMCPVHKYNCDISACGFTIMELRKRLVQPADCAPGLYEKSDLEYLKKNYYRNFNIQNSRCIKVFKKELILKQIEKLDYSITLCEDQTITVRAILNCESLYITNTYGYFYRIIDESMSHKFNEKLIANYDKVCDSIISAFINNGYMNKYVYSNLLNSLISVIGFIVFSEDTLNIKINYLKQLRSYKNTNKVLKKGSKSKINIRWRLIYILYRYKLYFILCLMAYVKKGI